MLTELELSELLNAKLCHDLTGPIGAINNGAEFLSEEEDLSKKNIDLNIKAKAIELIESSASQAVSRLKLFRQAYGPVPMIGETRISSIKKLVEDFYSPQSQSFRNIEFKWLYNGKPEQDETISHRVSKLVLNMIIIVTQSLIFGGEIIIDISEEENKCNLIFTAEGRGAKIDKTDLSILVGKASKDSITSRNIHYYYTFKVANLLNVSLSADSKKDKLIFNYTTFTPSLL